MADKYLKDCLADSKQTQDYKMEITCLAKLSTLKQIQKDWQMAVYYADLALQKADSTQLLESINQAYKVLSESYAVARENEVEITVWDNGVGMHADILEKLFKGNVTTRGTQNEKGTGLGLLMVKDFLEKNKGSIRVESEVGKGSSFVVILPKGSTFYPH